MWNRNEPAPAPAGKTQMSTQGEAQPAPEPPTPPASRPTPVASPVASSGIATIGSSVVMNGELRASEDLTVHGTVEGRIDVPDHTLTVGQTATVNATIAAKAIIVLGSVSGSIVAHDAIEVRSSASINGDITCTRISVEEGAVLTGKVTMPGRKAKGNGAAPDMRVASMAVAS